MKRFEETLAPFRLRGGLQDEAALQELKKDCPWNVSDRELEALKLKARTCGCLNLCVVISPAVSVCVSQYVCAVEGASQCISKTNSEYVSVGMRPCLSP